MIAFVPLICTTFIYSYLFFNHIIVVYYIELIGLFTFPTHKINPWNNYTAYCHCIILVCTPIANIPGKLNLLNILYIICCYVKYSVNVMCTTIVRNLPRIHHLFCDHYFLNKIFSLSHYFCSYYSFITYVLTTLIHLLNYLVGLRNTRTHTLPPTYLYRSHFILPYQHIQSRHFPYTTKTCTQIYLAHTHKPNIMLRYPVHGVSSSMQTTVHLNITISHLPYLTDCKHINNFPSYTK